MILCFEPVFTWEVMTSSFGFNKCLPTLPSPSSLQPPLTSSHFSCSVSSLSFIKILSGVPRNHPSIGVLKRFPACVRAQLLSCV